MEKQKTIYVHNHNDRKLLLIIEPLGEWYIVEPETKVQIVDLVHSSQPNFEIDYHKEFIIVWTTGEATVFQDGVELEQSLQDKRLLE